MGLTSFTDLNRDYQLELSLGNIPGRELVTVFGRIPTATSHEISDVWSGSSISPIRVESTTNESWEIVSDSADDSSSGVGAREVETEYLTEGYIRKTVKTSLDGLTPVNASSDMFRHIKTRVTSKGSGKGNVGNIEIRVSGGGDLKGYISAPTLSAVGQPNRTMDTLFTIDAGKTGLIVGFIGAIEKNKDIVIDLKTTNGDDGILITRLDFTLYQQSFNSQLRYLTEPIQEKSDIRCQCISSNTEVSAAFGYQLILVDN